MTRQKTEPYILNKSLYDKEKPHQTLQPASNYTKAKPEQQTPGQIKKPSYNQINQYLNHNHNNQYRKGLIQEYHNNSKSINKILILVINLKNILNNNYQHTIKVKNKEHMLKPNPS